MGIGSRIREAREEAGMTQADLAFVLRDYPTLTKLIPSRISDWENERVGRLSFQAVSAIAQVTGKPLEFFSELDGGQPPGAASNDPDPDPAPRDVAGGVREAFEQQRPAKSGRSPKRSPS